MKPPKTPHRYRRLLLGLMAGLRIPAIVANPVTQASVACSVRNLFPGVHWDRLAWPLIEDLVNNPAFASFHQWALTHAPDFDGKLGPQI